MSSSISETDVVGGVVAAEEWELGGEGEFGVVTVDGLVFLTSEVVRLGGELKGVVAGENGDITTIP